MRVRRPAKEGRAAQLHTTYTTHTQVGTYLWRRGVVRKILGEEGFVREVRSGTADEAIRVVLRLGRGEVVSGTI
jgi:hypothetical protein